jgi:hypothetical protein
MKYTISANQSTLTISCTSGESYMLKQRIRDEIQSDAYMMEWMSGWLARTDLDWIDPSETGDLTAAPMLARRDGDGMVTARWAFMDYQVRSVLEDLRDKGEVVFVGGLVVPELDEFTRAYLEAVRFTNGGPDNPDFEAAEFSVEFLLRAIADCRNFQQTNDLSGYPLERAGHDFWFTRNHHGVGFWENDFGTAEQCEKLTKASHAAGQLDACVGDDGKIY